ncbi:Telomerase reverse transcriptase [Microbotryomycetes sp. JL221]|nr:Telomerase reverse transcriptase [Microbotryomycetes sp. JL221]
MTATRCKRARDDQDEDEDDVSIEREVARVRPTHSLLRKYYNRLSTVSNLFRDQVGLATDHDTPEYTRFVNESMVAFVQRDTRLTVQFERHVQDVNMSEVIEQAQTRIFVQHRQHVKQTLQQDPTTPRWTLKTPQHVLTLGYRPSDDRDSIVNLGRAVNFVKEQDNTIVTMLCSCPEWSTLLERVGPSPIIQLLSTPDVALFCPLPNACFLQVSGKPVLDLTPTLLKPKTIGNSTNKDNSNGNTTTAICQNDKRRRNKKRKRPNLRTRSKQQQQSSSTTVEMNFDPTKDFQDIVWEDQQDSDDEFGLLLHREPVVCTGKALVSHRSEISTVGVTGLANKLTTTATAATTIAASEGIVLKKRKIETRYTCNEVVFGKHRLFHARASFGHDKKLMYGLGHKNILTRLPSLFNLPKTISDCSKSTFKQTAARHVSKYIFPRQFGLHNPFTEKKVNARFDILPDYDDRDNDIKSMGTVKTPERLKRVLPLISRLILLHNRCNFRKLLDKLAPSKTKKKEETSQMHQNFTLELPSQLRTQVLSEDISIEVSNASLIEPHGAQEAMAKVEAKPRFEDYVCSMHEVDRFVTTVVQEVIPKDFWGSKSNFEIVLKHVRALLRSRRFEFMSVHTILQGFCVSDCDWLRPRSSSNSNNHHQPISTIETTKRLELLQEFIFWFIDGFLMSLLRTCFYVTDSTTHVNRALFFRQDDWNKLTKPLLSQLGQTTFEKIALSKAQQVLEGRDLGFSFIRLMPKATGVRPIVNLARRPLVTGPKGRLEVGKTINKILQSAFDVLTYEKSRNPALVGSLVLSPQEIYSKIKTYKQNLIRLSNDGITMPKLYFVKVDAQACYDTIKQDKLLEIVERILDNNEYIIRQYGQVMAVASKPARQFKRTACSTNDLQPFVTTAMTIADNLHHALIVDQVREITASRQDVVRLLREHITTNLIKIGQRLFKQKNGIPQGSVLSSLLCSLFYGDMEKIHLDFTNDDESLMLRYVDDFMFISTNKSLAIQFLKTMSQGIPDYGCTISIEKRLTNFDFALEPGELVPPLSQGKDFPWCGLLINPTNLSISANLEVNVQSGIADKLTVQHYRRPGSSFINTMLRAVKIRSHVIYNDTTHNSIMTVYTNTYQALLIVALKFQAYVQLWGADPRKQPKFFQNVIHQVVRYHFAVVQSRMNAKASKLLGAKYTIKRSFVMWLGYHAFYRVLKKKPAVWSGVLNEFKTELDGSIINHTTSNFLYRIVRSSVHDFVERTNL